MPKISEVKRIVQTKRSDRGPYSYNQQTHSIEYQQRFGYSGYSGGDGRIGGPGAYNGYARPNAYLFNGLRPQGDTSGYHGGDRPPVISGGNSYNVRSQSYHDSSYFQQQRTDFAQVAMGAVNGNFHIQFDNRSPLPYQQRKIEINIDLNAQRSSFSSDTIHAGIVQNGPDSRSAYVYGESVHRTDTKTEVTVSTRDTVQIAGGQNGPDSFSAFVETENVQKVNVHQSEINVQNFAFYAMQAVNAPHTQNRSDNPAPPNNNQYYWGNPDTAYNNTYRPENSVPFSGFQPQVGFGGPSYGDNTAHYNNLVPGQPFWRPIEGMGQMSGYNNSDTFSGLQRQGAFGGPSYEIPTANTARYNNPVPDQSSIEQNRQILEGNWGSLFF